MTKKDLIDLLSEYPDNSRVMITIQTQRNGDFSCLDFEVTAVQSEMGKVRYIELLGEVDEDRF